jgi:hypothetical protein
MEDYTDEESLEAESVEPEDGEPAPDREDTVT